MKKLIFIAILLPFISAPALGLVKDEEYYIEDSIFVDVEQCETAYREGVQIPTDFLDEKVFLYKRNLYTMSFVYKKGDDWGNGEKYHLKCFKYRPYPVQE